MLAKLRDDLIIRVWGGDLESYRRYSFDFVDSEHCYILAPHDVKVYSMATAFSPPAQVLSLQESLEQAKATSIYSHVTRLDPNRETYIIFEVRHSSPYYTAEPPGPFCPHSHANPL